MGHLEDTGLGYVEHMRGALGLAKSTAYATCVLVVHAFFPDMYGTTGTDTLKAALHKLESASKKDE